MIHGVGIDLIEVARIDRALQRWGDRFLKRVYSGAEIEYCRAKQFSARHYAARFAAKEACLKSLGIGLGGPVALRDISVVNRQGGRPELIIDTDLHPVLKTPRSFHFYLSMTHSREFASAVVILELVEA